MPSKLTPPKRKIEDFEKNGPGTDAKGRRTLTEDMKRTSFELPIALHKEFRTLCFLAERPMGAVVEDLIRAEVARMKKEGG